MGNEFMGIAAFISAAMPDKELVKIIENDLSKVKEAIDLNKENPWQKMEISSVLLTFKIQTNGDIEKTFDIVKEIGSFKDKLKKAEDLDNLEKEVDNIIKNKKPL